MRIPICLRVERGASMDLCMRPERALKCMGPETVRMEGCVLIGHSLECESQEWTVVACYLDVKVSVLQIHR